MSRKPYKSDLTDAQWERLKPLIPPEKSGGRSRTVNLREIFNGIFYVLRTGCPWEMMPHDLPPYSTVYYYFRRWQKNGIWQQMNDALRSQVRSSEGRNPEASGGSVDSQSVKTTEKADATQPPPAGGWNAHQAGEVYGYDGGKQVKGRKRHLMVDTQGLLLGVVVTEANAQDRLGGSAVLLEAEEKSQSLELLWVDGGYSGKRFADVVAHLCGAKVEVIKRAKPGFQVLPRRWVVERTLGWLGRYRRSRLDYELLSEVSEAMIYGAMVRLMLNRLVS